MRQNESCKPSHCSDYVRVNYVRRLTKRSQIYVLRIARKKSLLKPQEAVQCLRSSVANRAVWKMQALLEPEGKCQEYQQLATMVAEMRQHDMEKRSSAQCASVTTLRLPSAQVCVLQLRNGSRSLFKARQKHLGW